MSKCVLYKGTKYSEQEGQAIVSRHYEIEDIFIERAGQGITVKERDGKFKLITIKKAKDFSPNDPANNARNIIGKINQDYAYGKRALYTGGEDGRIVYIDINTISTQVVEDYWRDEITKEFSQPYKDQFEYDADDKLITYDELTTDTQYRKAYNLDNVDEETLASFQAKANHMKAKFEGLGVNVEIVLDGDLPASGALLGTASDQYQDLLRNGTIVEGQPVIAVNPAKIFGDTLFHEFGHIMIDMLGGLKNKRLAFTWNKLKDTELAKQVAEEYPELSGENFVKEVLATAVGKEANQLFSKEQDKSFIKRFQEWFVEQIKQLLGISDGVRGLANMLLHEEFQTEAFVTEQTQYQKATNPELTFLEVDYKSTQGIVEQTIKRLNSLIITRQNIQDENSEAYKEATEEMRNNIKNKLDKVGPRLALYDFLFNITRNTEENKGELVKLYEALPDTPEELRELAQDTKKRPETLIKNVDRFTGAFDILLEIKKNSLELKKEFDNEDLYKDFVKALDNAISMYQDIKNKKYQLGKYALAHRMAPYSNYTWAKTKERLEKEWLENNEKLAGESDRDFRERKNSDVLEQLADNTDEINEAEYNRLVDSLERSPNDVSSFALWFYDEKEMNSTVIQLTSKLIDEADLKRDLAFMKTKAKANAIWEKYAAKHKGTSPEEMYKDLYQEDSNGTKYLMSEYKIDWLIKRKELLKNIITTKQEYGEDHEIFIQAKKDLFYFDKDNSNAVEVEGDVKYKPNNKWINPAFSRLDAEQKELLDFLQDRAIDTDRKTNFNLSNVISADSVIVEWYKLPAVGKNFFEKLVTGDTLNSVKDGIERMYKIKGDDTEYAGVSEDPIANADEAMKKTMDRDVLRVAANLAGEERQNIPIHFRGNLGTNQSLDLLSIYMMDSYMAENFHQKSIIQSTIELLRDISSEKEIRKTQGMMKRVMVSAFNKEELEHIKPLQGRESREFKALSSIIENRMYGIKTIHAEYAKIASTMMSWTGTTMLGLNYFSGAANLLQGKVFNFIEGFGGKHFGKDNLRNAESIYWKDMGSILDDLGRPIAKSKTNLLTDALNIQGEFKAISSRFLEDNRFKALAKRGNLFFLNHLGEHYMHSTLMYAILDRIKVKDAKGNYIDGKGNVVKNKADAMSLHEAFTVKDGELILNPKAKFTDFGRSKISLDPKKGKGLLEVKNYVNKIANDIHGQYNEEYQSMAQRYVIGKMAFMLRKWIIRGVNRRWRGAIAFKKNTNELREGIDEFYSEDLQEVQEGYYTSTLRFFYNVIKDAKEMAFTEAFSGNFKTMSDKELSNFRKTMMEALIITFTFVASQLLRALAMNYEPEDPRRESIMFMAFLSRRLMSEMAFYSNPLETLKILRSPSAALSYTESLLKLASQTGSDTIGLFMGEGIEYYERGPLKDTPKIRKKIYDVAPVMKNITRDIETTTSYTFNLF